MPLVHEPLAEYPSLLRITWPLPALRSNWNSPLARLLISNLPAMPAPRISWMNAGFCRCVSDEIVIRQSAQRLLLGAASPAPRLHALSTARHSARRIAGVRRTDRKSVVSGKSVSVRVDLGGRRILKQTKNKYRMP